jgi:hypothetical protein
MSPIDVSVTVNMLECLKYYLSDIVFFSVFNLFPNTQSGKLSIQPLNFPPITPKHSTIRRKDKGKMHRSSEKWF